MRPTRLKCTERQRGLTLIEMIVAMIIVAIVVGITIFFVSPLQLAVDTTTRAELTDIADNALQRIRRDVRLALPNSVRATSTAIEFIPLRTAARYRAESSGLCVVGNNDNLEFGVADGCFKSIGPIPDAGTVTTSDFLVLNNYGEGFSGAANQDAYAGGNRRQISAPGVVGQTVNYTAGSAFSRNQHDSPGKRFYVVTTPVSYVCDLAAKEIRRYESYGFNAGQVVPPGGTSTLLASNVSDCEFEYLQNVAPMVGLLTMRITLSKAIATGTQTVRLYHAVHINNVP